MSLLKRLRDALGNAWKPAPPPSSLRNKPGGLARVRIVEDAESGAGEMNGCYVTTVRLDGHDFWIIEPPLHFTVRTHMLVPGGRFAQPGDPAIVESMHDDLLVPVPQIGEEERSEETRFQPAPPVKQGERV